MLETWSRNLTKYGLLLLILILEHVFGLPVIFLLLAFSWLEGLALGVRLILALALALPLAMVYHFSLTIAFLLLISLGSILRNRDQVLKQRHLSWLIVGWLGSVLVGLIAEVTWHWWFWLQLLLVGVGFWLTIKLIKWYQSR